jgi:hypothetical protein
MKGKIEGRLEMTGRRGKSCKQLLVGLMENKGYGKWK